jgi:hypothetical protein
MPIIDFILTILFSMYRPYNNPVNYLSYVENFMYMLDRLSENNYRPHPVLARVSLGVYNNTIPCYSIIEL